MNAVEIRGVRTPPTFSDLQRGAFALPRGESTTAITARSKSSRHSSGLENGDAAREDVPASAYGLAQAATAETRCTKTCHSCQSPEQGQTARSRLFRVSVPAGLSGT